MSAYKLIVGAWPFGDKISWLAGLSRNWQIFRHIRSLVVSFRTSCPLSVARRQQVTEAGRNRAPCFESHVFAHLSVTICAMDAKSLFEILIREHADKLMVYLRAVVRDPAAVDDLFQETMLTAWRNIDRFDRERPFGPWLRGIAGKLVLAWRRKSCDQPRLCDAEILELLDQRLTQTDRLPGDTLDEQLEALRDC